MLTVQISVLLIFGAVLANAVWLSNRIFFLWALPSKHRIIWRLFQWVVYGTTSLLVFWGAEYYFTGDVYEQDWEFYVSVFFLYMILSFPGFVYRLYTRKW